jgi:hypothetical protein
MVFVRKQSNNIKIYDKKEYREISFVLFVLGVKNSKIKKRGKKL